MNSRQVVIAHLGIAIVLVALGVWHIYLQNKFGAFGFALMLVGSLIIGTKSYKLAKAREKRGAQNKPLPPLPVASDKDNEMNRRVTTPDLDMVDQKVMLAYIGTTMGVQGPVDELAEYLADSPDLLHRALEKDQDGRWRLKMVETDGPVVINYTKKH